MRSLWRPTILAIVHHKEMYRFGLTQGVRRDIAAAVGLKVTVIAQLAAAASELPQVVVSEKSPLIVMLLTASACEPLFVSVIVCAALAVPTP